MRPREHYLQQLETLNDELRMMGQTVIEAISRSVHAFLNRDTASANAVLEGDHQIDQTQHRLDEHVIQTIATQQPVASDLRWLITAMEIASELERIGDYGKGIARITLRDAARPPMQPISDLNLMADAAQGMLRNCVEGYISRSIAPAEQIAEQDNQVDALNLRVRAEIGVRFQQGTISHDQFADLLFVAHYLERIADRATNIAERLVYMVEGRTIELNP